MKPEARYIITIDRDALDKSSDEDLKPIRVEDTKSGVVVNERVVGLPYGAEVYYGPARQDGARVWIEAPGYVSR